mmetsp:Transcript_60606/g.167990  ORF Transcript_60606/g.167990 Transcript_60606/m.167990 type:complete len:510 (-) Transcript_60606:224-1753(-)
MPRCIAAPLASATSLGKRGPRAGGVRPRRLRDGQISSGTVWHQARDRALGRGVTVPPAAGRHLRGRLGAHREGRGLPGGCRRLRPAGHQAAQEPLHQEAIGVLLQPQLGRQWRDPVDEQPLRHRRGGLPCDLRMGPRNHLRPAGRAEDHTTSGGSCSEREGLPVRGLSGWRGGLPGQGSAAERVGVPRDALPLRRHAARALRDQQRHGPRGLLLLRRALLLQQGRRGQGPRPEEGLLQELPGGARRLPLRRLVRVGQRQPPAVGSGPEGVRALPEAFRGQVLRHRLAPHPREGGVRRGRQVPGPSRHRGGGQQVRREARGLLLLPQLRGRDGDPLGDRQPGGPRQGRRDLEPRRRRPAAAHLREAVHGRLGGWLRHGGRGPQDDLGNGQCPREGAIPHDLRWQVHGHQVAAHPRGGRVPGGCETAGPGGPDTHGPRAGELPRGLLLLPELRGPHRHALDQHQPNEQRQRGAGLQLAARPAAAALQEPSGQSSLLAPRSSRRPAPWRPWE